MNKVSKCTCVLAFFFFWSHDFFPFCTPSAPYRKQRVISNEVRGKDKKNWLSTQYDYCLTTIPCTCDSTTLYEKMKRDRNKMKGDPS